MPSDASIPSSGGFPIGDGGATEAEACAAAVDAARASELRLERLNRERAAALDFGIDLHVGDVMYGNIGVPDRLQFTVVGRAANEVARLQNLNKSLHRRVLATGQFAQNLDIPWEPMGAHELLGVGAPLEVFALPEAAASTDSTRVA